MQENAIFISSRGRRLGRLVPVDEGAHIDVARLRVAPAQIPGRHDERRLITQDLAELVQLTPQVGQRLPVCRVRPEQAGDALAGLGRASVEDQEGNEGNRA